MSRPTLNKGVMFAIGRESMGWRPVYLVDEAGNILHTEPVCTYPVKWHGWFEEWIQKQDVPEAAGLQEPK